MAKNISKKKASMRNMALMGIYQVITAVFGFVLPSMILNTYGANMHGYTSTVSSIMNYIALVNAGLAPAAIQALYVPLAAKDSNRMNQVLNAIDRLYIISGCLYTIAVTIIAFILPLVISNQLPSFMVISLMLVIGASSTLECFIYSKYRVLLQADQKLFIVSITDTIVYFIRIITQVLLIKAGASIIWVMFIPVVMVVLRMAILSNYCKQMYPGIDRKVKADTSALSKRWSAMTHQLTGMVVYNTDITLLTIFGSLVEVSIYSVYSLVFNHLYLFLTNIFSHGTMASFGQLIGEKRKDALLKAFDLYEFGYYTIVTFIYGVSASMILPFVSVYTKKYTDISYVDVKLAILFMIIGIANNMRLPSLTLISAAGHFKETQWRSVLEAVINLLVSLLLIKPLGMYGLLIGTVCSFLYRTTDVIYYTHRHILEISCKKTIMRLIRALAVILLSAAIYNILIGKYVLDSWEQWIFYAIITSIITGALTIITSYVIEPAQFKECIVMVIKRKSK